MASTALAQPTKIAPWGNSDAIRIPRAILKRAGLATGDSVDIVVNERNNIEVRHKKKTHRCVKPARGITFDSLFASYQEGESAAVSEGWPNEDMVGSEFESWTR